MATGGRGLTLFDGRALHLTAWSFAAQPTALESTGDGAGILVGAEAGAESGAVGWIRRADGAELVQRPLGGPVRRVALDREGRRVFALVAGARGGLAVLRADGLTEERVIPVCPEPVSLSFTREGDRAYVICRPGTVAEVDARLLILVRTGAVAGDSGALCGAGRGALSANGTLLFVPCARTGQLLYVDRATLRPWDSVSVGVGAAVTAVTPGAVAVTVVPDSDRVALVDLRSKALLARISTPPNPVDVALNATGRVAFVVTAGRAGTWGTLLAVDTQTGAELKRAGLGPGARAVYAWPGQRSPRMYWTSPPPLEPPQP